MILQHWIGILVFFTLFSGCGHVRIPVTHLDLPETRGEGIGKLEVLGIAGGHQAIVVSDFTSASPLNDPPTLGRADFNPFLGGWIPLSKQVDVGSRIYFGGPLMGRIRYQITGDPESTAKPGNIAASLTGSIGFMLGSGSTDSARYLASTFLFDAGVCGGYRLTEVTFLYLGASFSVASISGNIGQGPGYSQSFSIAGSGNQWSINLGSAFQWAGIFPMLELARSQGSFGTAESTYYGFGTSVGFRL